GSRIGHCVSEVFATSRQARGSYIVFSKPLRPLDKLEERMIFHQQEIPFDPQKTSRESKKVPLQRRET
ncbi:MAG: hypothetical protein RR182_08040, partial [Alistipes sp.]